MGVVDIRGWLISEHNSGRAIISLAAATGRSDAGIRSRLRGTTTTPTSRSVTAELRR